MCARTAHGAAAGERGSPRRSRLQVLTDQLDQEEEEEERSEGSGEMAYLGRPARLSGALGARMRTARLRAPLAAGVAAGAAGSRQQAAGSRQQAAGSRQQAAGSRQQGESAGLRCVILVGDRCCCLRACADVDAAYMMRRVGGGFAPQPQLQPPGAEAGLAEVDEAEEEAAMARSRVDVWVPKAAVSLMQVRCCC
jgi:hypothetical protein